MQETRAEAMHRLQREGRWEEASAYRQEVRKQQRVQGKTKAKAGQIAWQMMAERFPPLGAGQGTQVAGSDGLSSEQFDELLRRTAGQGVDLIRDVLWTYENLANTNAAAEDAPSMGAWSLLEWARNYRNHFFERLLPKALTAKERQGETRKKRWRGVRRGAWGSWRRR